MGESIHGCQGTAQARIFRPHRFGLDDANTQGSAFTFDLNFTDTNTHQVALYCADWIGAGTILEKIDLFESSDTSYAHPLDVRSFQLPSNGVYLVWRFAGHKIIRVIKLDANINTKALVNALFIGSGP